MGERWLTVELDREPEHPAGGSAAAPAADRRPAALRPVSSPGWWTVWRAVAGAVVVAGAVAVLVGAWLVAASGVRWNGIARDAAEVRRDLGERSRIAAASLSDELAGLQSTASTLEEVSDALEAASGIAADLEAVATGGLTSGPGSVETLVREIDLLAGAIDAAFPGLAELGVTGPEGPGGALQAAGAALVAVSEALAPGSATGFGPFVLQYPLPGHPVTDSFGTVRGDGLHGGIDIGAPAGTPILAADDGLVLRAGRLEDGAGNGVILRHEQGWETRYFHMDSADLPVADGDLVTAGQVIGYVGSTGWSTGPHLHFEIVFGPVRLDPEGWFTYVGRDAWSGASGNEPKSVPSGPAAVDPGEEPAPREAPVLSDVPSGVAEVRRELMAIGTDASIRAVVLEQRRVAERGRGETAVLVLYGGAVAVVVGLSMWVIRPRRPGLAPFD